jgi:hypothetical protein
MNVAPQRGHRKREGLSSSEMAGLNPTTTMFLIVRGKELFCSHV